MSIDAYVAHLLADWPAVTVDQLERAARILAATPTDPSP